MSSHTTLFSTILEKIMSGGPKEHDKTISVDDRTITNLRFADEIDVLAEEEKELEALAEWLDKT